MNSCADFCILGGGVIGLTTAYFLAKGGGRVIVLDKGECGQEASWAGAGILPPSKLGQAQTPFERLRALSAALFPELSQQLLERTGVDNGFRVCGGLEFKSVHQAADHEEWHGPGARVEEIDESV